jgi:outer membrane protein TolC
MNDAYYLMIKESLIISEKTQKTKILMDTKETRDELYNDAKLKFNMNRLSKYDLNIIKQSQISVQMQYQQAQANLLHLKDKFVVKYKYLSPVPFTFLSDENIKKMEISLINNLQIKTKSIEKEQQEIILETHKLEKTFKPNLSLEASLPIGLGGVEPTQYSAKINVSDFTWREGQYNTVESSLKIAVQKQRKELLQLKNDLNLQLRENLTLLNQLIDQVVLQEQYEELLINKRSDVIELFAAGRVEAEQVARIDMELFNFRLERLENAKQRALIKLELLKLQGLLTVRFLGLEKLDG